MIESHETFQLTQAAKRYKIWIAAAGLLIAVMAIGWGFDKYQSWQSIREFEKAATKAQQEKEAALELAEKVASTIKVREEELFKVEVKRDEKRGEVKSAADAVSRDRAEYERAVRERRPDGIPGPKQLCAELAQLGHPCRDANARE